MSNRSAFAVHTQHLKLLKFFLATALIHLMIGMGAYATGNFFTYAAWTGGSTLLFFTYLVYPALGDYRARQGASFPTDVVPVVIGVSAASLAFSATLTGLGVGVLAVGKGLVMLVTALQLHATPKFAMVVLTAAATILVGGAFFYFRLKQRFLYGATEAAAGVAIAAHRMSVEPAGGIPSDTGFYVALLTAGVYLFVRGLDNMHQGIKLEEPAARLLLSWPTTFAWSRTRSGNSS